jgi:hypothetical protein
MCSVSFAPDDDGFILAMNRDERLSRGPALPPEVFERDGLAVLCPRETTGGTWIGVNSARMAFSLLNWHSKPDCVTQNPVSRGEVVRALLQTPSRVEATRELKKLPLGRMNPFRLIVVSAAEPALVEWRSCDGELDALELPWKRNHWFSSGLDEVRAGRSRQRVCDRMAGELFDLKTVRSASKSCSESRPIFFVYAFPRCRNGQLRRNQRSRELRADVLRCGKTVLARAAINIFASPRTP